MTSRSPIFLRKRIMRRLSGAASFAFLLASAPAAFADVDIAPSQNQAAEAGKPPAPEGAKVEKVDLKEKWGVEILAIRLTASDHMIDFRYKVLDPEKAAPIFKRENKPYLMHSTTGKVLSVPAPAKTGPLRTSDPPKAGRSYWMFFGNGPGLIKKGDLVTVIIGDFRAEKLVVE